MMSQIALTYADAGKEIVRNATFSVPKLRAFSSFELANDDWSSQVQRRLNRLTNLPVGWDGYNAQRVSTLTARFAWDLLSSVMTKGTAAPSVVPVTGGGLQIEWHRNGLDIELYVSKPMKAELFVSYSDDRPDLEIELTSDFRLLSSALAELA